MTKGASLSGELTLKERCYAVAGPGGERIGAVIQTAGGKFAAWTTNGKAGEFASMDLAERAVRAAKRAEKAKARR
jgi:hypothetical protein